MVCKENIIYIQLEDAKLWIKAEANPCGRTVSLYLRAVYMQQKHCIENKKYTYAIYLGGLKPDLVSTVESFNPKMILEATRLAKLQYSSMNYGSKEGTRQKWQPFNKGNTETSTEAPPAGQDT